MKKQKTGNNVGTKIQVQLVPPVSGRSKMTCHCDPRNTVRAKNVICSMTLFPNLRARLQTKHYRGAKDRKRTRWPVIIPKDGGNVPTNLYIVCGRAIHIYSISCSAAGAHIDI